MKIKHYICFRDRSWDTIEIEVPKECASDKESIQDFAEKEILKHYNKSEIAFYGAMVSGRCKAHAFLDDILYPQETNWFHMFVGAVTVGLFLLWLAL